MAAVVNATDMTPQPEGLRFPPCEATDLPHVCSPHSDGGQLSRTGTVEVVSSLERDGRVVHDHLRHGFFVTLKASTLMSSTV